MRKVLVLLVGGIDLALLVATSPPAQEVITDSRPVPMELRLDESTPDLVLEVDYTVEAEDFYGGVVELALLGDNTLPPGDAVLQLFELQPGDDGEDGAPLPGPLAEVAIGGQVGEEPWPVDEVLAGEVTLAAGEHTKRFLLHLEGSADLVLEAEVLLGLTHTPCDGFLFPSCSEATLAIVEVR